MSENDYSQPEDTELKITSIRGGCSDLHFDEDYPDKHGCKEEPAPTVSEARDRLFDEMEKTDPENIASNVSSLSLGVKFDEVAVLCQILENSYINDLAGHCEVIKSSRCSLQYYVGASNNNEQKLR